MSPEISVLYDTIRWEEKALLEAGKKKNINLQMVDCKKISLDLDSKPDDFGIVLQRCVSYYRNLHSTAALEGMGLVITNALSKVSERYDYVIIDSPPMLGVLMINALAACEHLLIPVLTEFLALKGLDRMLHTMQMVFHTRKNAPDYTIVPTMFDKRTRAAKESLKVLREQYPKHIWESVIPVDTKLREASQAGLPAAMYAPNSRAVEAYADLLELLLAANAGAKKQLTMA